MKQFTGLFIVIIILALYIGIVLCLWYWPEKAFPISYIILALAFIWRWKEVKEDFLCRLVIGLVIIVALEIVLWFTVGILSELFKQFTI